MVTRELSVRNPGRTSKTVWTPGDSSCLKTGVSPTSTPSIETEPYGTALMVR
jgi:hypothetical protein